MGAIKSFFKRLDFNFYPVTFLPFIIAVLTPFAVKYLPVELTYENSLLENFQLVLLFICLVICINAKTDKKFYYFLALVCTILFLREINCGRTIFFPVYGSENAFYSWKDIKYGYLAHPLFGAYMLCCFLYFVFTKSYKVLIKYILKAKLSFYNWLFMFLGIIFGTLGEKIGNFALEEMTEMLFYASFLALIFLSGYMEDYIKAADEK